MREEKNTERKAHDQGSIRGGALIEHGGVLIFS
jgi:hypothetical protein